MRAREARWRAVAVLRRSVRGGKGARAAMRVECACYRAPDMRNSACRQRAYFMRHVAYYVA